MRESNGRRAVVTGLGVVSPVGIGVTRFWSSLIEAKSGIDHIKGFDVSDLPPECRIAGEVRDFDPSQWMSRPRIRGSGRFSQFAVTAAKLAFQDADLSLNYTSTRRVVVSLGTSMSGLVDIFLPAVAAFSQGTDMSLWAAREYPAQAATVHVTDEIGAKEAGMTIATGCAAGLDAIAWAANRIRAGEADAAIAAATETPLSPPTLDAFRLYGLLSKWSGPPAAASRPFDLLRTGLVVAEGAAALLIEDEDHARSRGARIYATLRHIGTAAETITNGRIEATGQSAAKSMSQALTASLLRCDDIDYICAHGNSIPDHDAAESAGIKLAFPARAESIPVSSIKSMCGQAFAASGVMQVLATCLALHNEIVPPTINYSVPDPRCDLDYVPNTARKVRVRHALVHVRSLGGTHVSLALSRA